MELTVALEYRADDKILRLITRHTGRKEIVAEIESLNTKLSKARDMVFDDKLDPDDFRKIKRECEDKIKRLELLLAEAKGHNSNILSIDKMIFQVINALNQLKKLYLSCDVLKKREILGSIFRENIRFDGTNYRTTRLNEGAELIYLITKELNGNKNGKQRLSERASRQVLRAVVYP